MRSAGAARARGEEARAIVRNRVVAVQFVLLALTWGSSFLFIKVGLEGLSPVQVVFARVVLGAAALGVLCLVRRAALPREPVVWLHLLVVALLLCVVPFLLFASAETRIDSGLASVYNATTPLMTSLVAAVALRDERFTTVRTTGLVLGFVGAVVLLAPWQTSGRTGVEGQLECLGATACYGVAFVYLRRFVTPRRLGAVPVATVQVGLAAVVMVLAAPAIVASPLSLTPSVLGAVVVLGVLGTGLAYAWNTQVVAAWGATNASTVTYLTPVVGVLLGVLLLGEQVDWNQPVGAVIVLLGVATAQGRLTGLARRVRAQRRSAPSSSA